MGPITPGATPDPAARPAGWSAWSEEPGRAVRVEVRWLAPELIKGLIKDGRALRAGDGPEGAALCAVRNEWAVISVLVGPPAHRQALFGVIVEEAHRAGARRVALFAPDAGTAAGLRAAFVPHPWCPDGLVIVQKTLPVG